MKHILIVDDLPENLFLLEALLKDEGYQVLSAQNGAEALEQARRDPPDLIISDILMPVMDGYTLCHEWRSDKVLHNIPFIFYTATFTEQQDRALAMELGANCFLTRPQDGAVLLATVRDVLDSAAAAAVPAEPEHSGSVVFKNYSSVLFNKLEKKMAELEESERYFRQLIMKSPVPVAVSNLAGDIELLNDTFVECFGYTLEDIGQPPWWPDVRQFTDDSEGVDMSATAGRMVRPASEQSIICKNGKVRAVQIFAAQIGRKLVVKFFDITERKHAEEERMELQRKMIQKDKLASLGQLAAGVAHEINTPVSFVGSNLENLQRYVSKYEQYMQLLENGLHKSGDDQAVALMEQSRDELRLNFISGDIHRLIDECIDGTGRVRKIANDFKVFSRDATVPYQCVDLNACLESTLTITWNEIKYVATLKKELGRIPALNCNPQQISQVFLNLLVNAAHAISEQGEITLRTWADRDAVYVSVSDTGCGIPVANMEKIFDPFFTTKSAEKGTGLGLFISREIVQKHGGNFLVSSKEGRGSTFTVRLPLEHDQADGKQAGQSSILTGAGKLMEEGEHAL